MAKRKDISDRLWKATTKPCVENIQSCCQSCPGTQHPPYSRLEKVPIGNISPFISCQEQSYRETRHQVAIITTDIKKKKKKKKWMSALDKEKGEDLKCRKIFSSSHCSFPHIQYLYIFLIIYLWSKGRAKGSSKTNTLRLFFQVARKQVFPQRVRKRGQESAGKTRARSFFFRFQFMCLRSCQS